MVLNKPAAYGIYSQDVALREVINTLNQAGFGNEDICVMLSPPIPFPPSFAMPASLIPSERMRSAPA